MYLVTDHYIVSALDTRFTSSLMSHTTIKWVTWHLLPKVTLMMSLLPFKSWAFTSHTSGKRQPSVSTLKIQKPLSLFHLLSVTVASSSRYKEHNLHKRSNATCNVFPHLNPLQANTHKGSPFFWDVTPRHWVIGAHSVSFPVTFLAVDTLLWISIFTLTSKVYRFLTN